MKEFKLKSPYKPLGDQPKAINSLAEGINDGIKEQTLLGVTGSGKTFTMANVIEKVQKPTLVHRRQCGRLHQPAGRFRAGGIHRHHRCAGQRHLLRLPHQAAGKLRRGLLHADQ